MTARLLYTLGPSGAGKDSLLAWLKDRLAPDAPLHFARRVIDRAPQATGEQHESVSAESFERQCSLGAFALHWKANGHHYGVRHSEFSEQHEPHWVVLNGSRAHLPQAFERFPGLTVLHITASAEVLRARLIARQRENAVAVEARVQRSVDWKMPAGCQLLQVRNDTSLEEAGLQLLKALQTLPDWPHF